MISVKDNTTMTEVLINLDDVSNVRKQLQYNTNNIDYFNVTINFKSGAESISLTLDETEAAKFL
ncbi:hypothetical protein [Acinetobacter modestus]|uniref:hypothetical protein n=1 Tax=Acinetobacter modestus TaxID=1776740 RepID=UPI003018E1C6